MFPNVLLLHKGNGEQRESFSLEVLALIRVTMSGNLTETLPANSSAAEVVAAPAIDFVFVCVTAAHYRWNTFPKDSLNDFQLVSTVGLSPPQLLKVWLFQDRMPFIITHLGMLFLCHFLSIKELKIKMNEILRNTDAIIQLFLSLH